MQRKPIEIKRINTQGVSITWSDHSVQEISSEVLRRNCPCATCRDARGELSHEKPLGGGKKSALRILSSSVSQELRLTEIWSVGNYALGLQWGDGHKTGIYTYQYLYELGEAAR